MLRFFVLWPGDCRMGAMSEGKSAFKVEGFGGKRALSGAVRVAGAKNAALKLMAASLLFETPVRFENVPMIEDIRRATDLLRKLGAKVEGEKGLLSVAVPEKSDGAFDEDISKRLRASIVLTGPALARYGAITFPHPGGCVIGARPIDLFLESFAKMGATVREEMAEGKQSYRISAPQGLKGAEIFFRTQSVTATETVMMAAVLARGTTVLKNAAQEPEIAHLAEFLRQGGARIEGAGTATIAVRGGTPLSRDTKPFRVMPDRIEAGSFLILAALAGKRVEITDCEPEHVRIVIEMLRLSGVPIEEKGTTLVVSAPPPGTKLKSLIVKTHEYPGFPTDLQAPMVVYLTQASGESPVFETIFEGRLNYVESLVRMGAVIETWDPHRVAVKGPTPLKGRELESPDLRAGLAFVIAAAVAKGTSIIHNVYNIDRGYERIEERLGSLGLQIHRIRL